MRALFFAAGQDEGEAAIVFTYVKRPRSPRVTYVSVVSCAIIRVQSSPE